VLLNFIGNKKEMGVIRCSETFNPFNSYLKENPYLQSIIFRRYMCNNGAKDPGWINEELGKS